MAYISNVCACALLYNLRGGEIVQVCPAARVIWHRAFLTAINSVHTGDTDVLRSFCCAHWPQSAASEGLRRGETNYFY